MVSQCRTSLIDRGRVCVKIAVESVYLHDIAHQSLKRRADDFSVCYMKKQLIGF
jgi:hypothetical protein